MRGLGMRGFKPGNADDAARKECVDSSARLVPLFPRSLNNGPSIELPHLAGNKLKLTHLQMK